MDAEEVTDAVPKITRPSGNFVPQPSGKALDAFPQSLYEVPTDFLHPADTVGECTDDSGNNLRDGFYDLGNDNRQILHQGNQQLNSGFDDERNVFQYGCYDAGNDARNSGDDRRNNQR